MSYRKLWIALVLVLVISFAVLGGVGINVMNNAPPIPSRVVTSDGRAVRRSHHHGRSERWQSIGGQEVGTIGATGLTSPPTGRQIGCTASRYSSWTVGQRSGAANYARTRSRAEAALQCPPSKQCFAPTRMTRQLEQSRSIRSALLPSKSSTLIMPTYSPWKKRIRDTSQCAQ